MAGKEGANRRQHFRRHVLGGAADRLADGGAPLVLAVPKVADAQARPGAIPVQQHVVQLQQHRHHEWEMMVIVNQLTTSTDLSALGDGHSG